MQGVCYTFFLPTSIYNKLAKNNLHGVFSKEIINRRLLIYTRNLSQIIATKTQKLTSPKKKKKHKR